MSEEVANKLLKATVAQLLLPVGWHNITNTSIQVLVDVMRRYIEGVGKTTNGYAEHGNRSLCNLDDLALAFDEYQITLPSLQEYLEEVDQLPFPHEVFQFPVKQPNKHVYESPIPPVTIGSTRIGENSDDNDDEEEEAWSPLIPSYLPPLPTKEETEKVDEEDDRESGIQVSDVEEMELGGEGNTPVDGQVPKGLPGMASSGRRGRTFSTDSDLSSEHDDHSLSKSSSADVTKQQSTVVVPTRVVPHRINPIRMSEAASPDPVVTPHDDEVSVSGISLDDSSLESDEEIEVEDKIVATPSKKRKIKEINTEDEASLQGSFDIVPEKKSSKKQQKSPSTPSARIIAKSETKETNSGPYKPTVSSKLLTRFTLAKDTSLPQEPAAHEGDVPQDSRLPELPPPLNLKSVPREPKVSLSSLSPLSSDISSPRSPLGGSKNMQLTLEKFPLESPTKRSYKLDSLSVSPVSPTTLSLLPNTGAALMKDDTTPLMSPTVTTNSEDEDSDASALSLKEHVSIKNESKLAVLPKAVPKTSNVSFTIGLGDKQLSHKKTASKTIDVTVKEKFVVSINRKYIRLPQHDAKRTPFSSHKKKSKAVSEGPRSLIISIPKQHYFHAMASRQKPKRPQTLSPATVKQDRKSKIKSALAEDRIQPVMSREVEATPQLPVVTPVADTPLSQPIKLRFKLSSDVVGESSISPEISKETIVPPMTAPVEWPSGGHSSHKKKRRHKKEKKKKKKKYHDSDSSSDSEGIYSEGNSAKNSPMPTTHIATSHILHPLATAVLPYQPPYPLAICPTCKLPDDGRPMIACDICDRWFHWPCVNVVTEPSDGMDWYCPECSRDNTGSGSSKRKEHKHKKKKKHSHDHD